jgi:hypothetical protein
VTLAMKPGRLATPARSCECRPSDQPASGRMPEPRRTESRSDPDHGESIDVGTFTNHSSLSVVSRLLFHAACPPHASLYIRIARLLI